MEIRLECRCLQKYFLIWKYYVSCLWAPLLVLTRTKETVSWSNFYNKIKILTILFIVKYEKMTLFDEFLVLLGPIISRFFACLNGEKIIKRVLTLVLSLWARLGWKVLQKLVTKKGAKLWHQGVVQRPLHVLPGPHRHRVIFKNHF